MQHQIAHRRYQSTQNEVGIGRSSYLVNNSLFCCMQPKRTSCDVKLYLQLNKKITRRTIIEKKFQESLTFYNNKVDDSRKGFKGIRIPLSVGGKTVKSPDKRMTTEMNHLKQTQSYFNPNHSVTQNISIINSSIDDELEYRYSAAQASHCKPNMMYNLTLYRRNYRRPDFKNENMCIKLIRNYKQRKAEKDTISLMFKSLKTAQ